MSEVTLAAIGVVRSPFTQQAGTPIQPAFAAAARGAIELDVQYQPALKDLEGFERIWALCYLDRAGPYRPVVVPFLDDVPHGLFATRSPSRPNPIGLSLLKLVSITGARLDVEGIDLLDGTPVLDIKPYIPEIDAASSSRAGWFDTSEKRRLLADDRFVPGIRVGREEG